MLSIFDYLRLLVRNAVLAGIEDAFDVIEERDHAEERTRPDRSVVVPAPASRQGNWRIAGEAAAQTVGKSIAAAGTRKNRSRDSPIHGTRQLSQFGDKKKQAAGANKGSGS